MSIEYALINWAPDNVLPRSAANFEDSTALNFWTTADHCTLALDTAVPSFGGTQHLRLRSNTGGTNNMSVTSPTGILGLPVNPGEQLWYQVHMQTAASARACFVSMLLYDINGALIWEIDGTDVNDATTVWTPIPLDWPLNPTSIVPTNGAFVALKITVKATSGTNEDHYVDSASLFRVQGPGPVTNMAYLAGDSSSSKITSPDSARLSMTGDIDLRVKAGMDTWTQTNGALISKWNTTGNQRSYRLYTDATPHLLLDWSNNGTTVLTKTSTVALPVTSGQALWVRATLDVNDGGGNNVVKFYTSPDGLSWTQLGATVTTAGTTSVFDSTSQLEIGSHSAVSSRMTNVLFFRAQAFASITDSVQTLDVDFSGRPTGTTAITDPLGNVVTIAGTSYLDEYKMGVGDTFGGYIINRSDDGDETWNPIAFITSLGVQTFRDYEGMRNSVALYEMQTERYDGSLSLFTDWVPANPSFTGCGYTFTSNESPSLNVEALDNPDRTYQVADNITTYTLYGRDFATVFRGLEAPGDLFTANIWLYMDGTPATNNVPDAIRGRRAFKRLENLALADISYVCVMDENGNRWFANLSMESSVTLKRTEPGGYYQFPIAVREVSPVPSTPDAQ